MHLALSTILNISAIASGRQVSATSFGRKRFSKAKEEVELKLEAPRTEWNRNVRLYSGFKDSYCGVIRAESFPDKTRRLTNFMRWRVDILMREDWLAQPEKPF